MDIVPIIFYAIVCGLLAWAVPQRYTPRARATIGIAVGIVAAFCLPVLRGAAGI